MSSNTADPPAAADACQAGVTVTCTPIAGTSLGANTSTCTAIDASGNVSVASITVRVLRPVRVEILAPLLDDNALGDIDADGDAFNMFPVGQAIINKIRLRACDSTVLSRDIADHATVRLTILYRDDAAGARNSIHPISAGVGSPSGELTRKGSDLQYNQVTEPANYPSGSWGNRGFFQNIFSVTWDDAPGRR